MRVTVWVGVLAVAVLASAAGCDISKMTAPSAKERALGIELEAARTKIEHLNRRFADLQGEQAELRRDRDKWKESGEEFMTTIGYRDLEIVKLNNELADSKKRFDAMTDQLVLINAQLRELRGLIEKQVSKPVESAP